MIDDKKLVEIVTRFSSERDWDQFHSIKNLSSALSVEASELLEIFQWMKEEDSNKVSENPVVLKKVEEEMADIFVYLLRLSSRLNIDLEKAVTDKMIINEKKYPADLVKGQSKKYNEY